MVERSVGNMGKGAATTTDGEGNPSHDTAPLGRWRGSAAPLPMFPKRSGAISPPERPMPPTDGRRARMRPTECVII